MPYYSHHILDAADTLKEKCHGDAVRAGWWFATTLGEIGPPIGRDIRHHATFAQCLMLIVSELGECMEGDRKQTMDDHLPHRTSREVELADAVIRIFDLAGAYGLDIGAAIDEKMEYNRKRLDHKLEARGVREGGKRY